MTGSVCERGNDAHVGRLETPILGVKPTPSASTGCLLAPSCEAPGDVLIRLVLAFVSTRKFQAPINVATLLQKTPPAVC